ncbi:MAG: glycosyltransferase family 4 protein, partial [Burkholderiales bacterium]|nr:glycosyltransferase family 4 protein [Burkholderiales bacterium]
KFICDRGSSHIQHQANLIQEEFKKWKLDFDEIDQKKIDTKIIRTEIDEYESSDLIFVPSSFSQQSFVDCGIPRTKTRLIPYGVDTKLFFPVESPKEDALDILFVGAMSLRKGIPYLVQAFKSIGHRQKKLRIIGRPSKIVIDRLRSSGIWDDRIEVLGHKPASELRMWMSKSHVMVLPSIEDGFGLVIAEALACGCPVIATEHSGGPDVITNGQNGFIVPSGDYLAIKHRIESIADSIDLQKQLRSSALKSVQKMGGWDQYIDAVQSSYKWLLN